uniref:Uncharacterized protein n=1 Tax=Arundo donax TaxID=35708 RepID=A0A0A9EI43_ARUDO
MDDWLPSAATSRSPANSTFSPVRSTRAVATTPRLSLASANDTYW